MFRVVRGLHKSARYIPVLDYRFLSLRRRNQGITPSFHTRFVEITATLESPAINPPKRSNFPSETLFRGGFLRFLKRRFASPTCKSKCKTEKLQTCLNLDMGVKLRSTKTEKRRWKTFSQDHGPAQSDIS
jgi:hypothetical protein